MHLDQPKKSIGIQEERHSIGRFVTKDTCYLLVTVLVSRNPTGRGSIYFCPSLINGTEKMVIFTHAKNVIAMNHDGVVKWIRTFI